MYKLSGLGLIHSLSHYYNKLQNATLPFLYHPMNPRPSLPLASESSAGWQHTSRLNKGYLTGSISLSLAIMSRHVDYFTIDLNKWTIALNWFYCPLCNISTNKEGGDNCNIGGESFFWLPIKREVGHAGTKVTGAPLSNCPPPSCREYSPTWLICYWVNSFWACNFGLTRLR